MSTGSIIKNNQKKSLLHRGFTAKTSISETQYLPPTQFKVGINNGTPTISKNDLDTVIPILDGTTNDDGSNTLTGSSGGDNSTDNTTTYKEGAGNIDDTAQNLIANNTNATKIWTISDLSTAGANCDSTKYIGLWLYIKDATALAKFLISGTALELRIGVDSTTNYYSQVYTVSELAIGWNWLSDGALLSTWTVNGTPGTLNNFQIRITTNNATDTFVAGDVVYDLLRQWEATDTVKDFVTGYPSINYTDLSVTTRSLLTATQANGFNIDGYGTFNEDTSPLMMSEDTTGGESKSRTDEFAFVSVDRFL